LPTLSIVHAPVLLLYIDESGTFDKDLEHSVVGGVAVQPLVLKWRQTGMRRRPWLGRLDRIVEVPLFVDSSTTRLLQAADIVAHSTYQHYERGDPSWLDPLLPAFDAGAGVLHGLVHLCPGYRNCTCPACVSRVARDRMRAAALRLAKQRRTPEAALHRFSA
jgi:hypothetical protein